MRVSILSDKPILSGLSLKKNQIFIIKSFILVLNVIYLAMGEEEGKQVLMMLSYYF